MAWFQHLRAGDQRNRGTILDRRYSFCESPTTRLVARVWVASSLCLKRLGNPVGEVWLINDCPRMWIPCPWRPKPLARCRD